MFFKIKKSKKTPFRAVTFLLVLIISGFSCIEQSLAGSPSSPYVDTLKIELIKVLIRDHVCENDQICREMLYMPTEGYSRIYLNMYGQTDTVLASHVAAFFVEKGLKITEGTPIALRVFPKPKDDYMGLRYAFGSNDYLMKLELNK